MRRPCIYLYNFPLEIHFRRPLETGSRGTGFSRFLLFAAGEGESLTAGGPCSTGHQSFPNPYIEVVYAYRSR